MVAFEKNVNDIVEIHTRNEEVMDRRRDSTRREIVNVFLKRNLDYWDKWERRFGNLRLMDKMEGTRASGTQTTESVQCILPIRLKTQAASPTDRTAEVCCITLPVEQIFKTSVLCTCPRNPSSLAGITFMLHVMCSVSVRNWHWRLLASCK